MKKKYISIVIVIILFFSVFFSIKFFGTQTSLKSEVGVISPLNPKNIAMDHITGVKYVTGQLVISYDRGISDEKCRLHIRELGGKVIGYLSDLNIYQVEFTDLKESESLYKLMKMEFTPENGVTSVSLNHISNNMAGGPIDPWKEGYNSKDEIWDEFRIDGSNWAQEAIRLPSAWSYIKDIKTTKVNIGVIDTGFYTNHEDLQIPDINSFGFENNSAPNEFVSERNDFHGTAVSGIIGAIQNNNKGIAGVVPNCNLIIFQPDTTRFSMLYGLMTLIKNDVKIINLSWGYEYEDSLILGLRSGIISKDIMDFLEDDRKYFEIFLKIFLDSGYDFLIVQSAGNDGINAEFNGLFSGVTNEVLKEHIIIVGGLANKIESDKHVEYEIYKVENEKAIKKYEMSNLGINIDIVAPGEDMYVPYGKKNEYENKSGTSFSAPLVTGVAGLIKSINPQLTSADIKNIILDSSVESFEYENNSYKILNAFTASQLANQTNNSDTYSKQKYTLNGTFNGIDCGDYCYANILGSDGVSYYFRADLSLADLNDMQIGQQVEVAWEYIEIVIPESGDDTPQMLEQIVSIKLVN